MKTKSKIIVIIMIIMASMQVNAQEVINSITRPVHISFITPLGTNGMQSWYVTNNISVNMVAGYSGGLNGVEVAGFYNVLKGNMNGVQLSGFGNTILGSTTGVQLSGFINTNNKFVTGVQMAGFANVVNDSIEAAQFSGFTNVVKGNVKGMQASGFANVNTGELEGVQISGFLNYTKSLKGTQIGFINVVDTVEKGAPIGFFSFVKNGYHKFEFGGNESLYGVASFKTGVNRFYNIFSAGVKIQDNKFSWGLGYGIGTMFSVSEKVDINIDAIAYHINEDESWTNHINMLNKLNINASVQLSENLSVFGGISWNVSVSDITDNEGNPFSSSVAPWNVYDKTVNDTNIKMYPGFTFGIRL